MSTLDEVSRYNVLKHELAYEHTGGGLTESETLVVLASDFDRLQSELSALKTSSGETFRWAVFHQDRANKAEAERDALKQALKDARPAIEDAACTFDREAIDNATLLSHYKSHGPSFIKYTSRQAEAEKSAQQLRGLLSLSEP